MLAERLLAKMILLRIEFEENMVVERYTGSSKNVYFLFLFSWYNYFVKIPFKSLLFCGLILKKETYLRTQEVS